MPYESILVALLLAAFVVPLVLHLWRNREAPRGKATASGVLFATAGFTWFVTGYEPKPAHVLTADVRPLEVESDGYRYGDE